MLCKVNGELPRMKAKRTRGVAHPGLQSVQMQAIGQGYLARLHAPRSATRMHTTSTYQCTRRTGMPDSGDEVIGVWPTGIASQEVLVLSYSAIGLRRPSKVE